MLGPGIEAARLLSQNELDVLLHVGLFSAMYLVLGSILRAVMQPGCRGSPLDAGSIFLSVGTFGHRRGEPRLKIRFSPPRVFPAEKLWVINPLHRTFRDDMFKGSLS